MLVTGQEQFVAHRAIRRNQVITGERHPVHHLVILWNVGVQYPECADNFAADVRQEWKLDVVSRAESFENFARVIGNRCGVDPVRLEFSKTELQLDELVAAVGSPIGAAAEDQQQPI
jgi:hypothetical protein